MATLGTIQVNVVARSEKFRRGMQQSQKSVQGFNARMKQMKVAAKAALVVMIALAVRGLFRLEKAAREAGDELAKNSRRIGETVENMSRLSFAAKIAGVDVSGLITSLGMLARNVADAADGTGEAVDAVNKLGLSSEFLKKAAPIDQLRLFAESLKNLKTQSEKIQVARDLFGRQGVQLLTLLEDGASGIDKFAARAEALGLTLSTELSKKFEETDDSITEMRDSWKALGRDTTGLITSFKNFAAGGLTDVAKALRDAGRDVGLFEKQAENIAKPIDELRKANEAALKVQKQAAVQTKLQKEAEKKAAEAQKERERIMERGKALFESLRTPMEAHAAALADMQNLLNVGAISWETYNRSVMASEQALKDATKAKDAFDSSVADVGAAIRGTSAGFTAASRGSELARKLNEIGRDQLKELKEANRLAIETKAVLEKSEGINVTEFRF